MLPELRSFVCVSNGRIFERGEKNISFLFAEVGALATSLELHLSLCLLDLRMQTSFLPV